MRPPISAANKNDGVLSATAPLHRKTKINQKEILADHQSVISHLPRQQSADDASYRPHSLHNSESTLNERNLYQNNVGDAALLELQQHESQLLYYLNENPSTSSSSSISSNDTAGFSIPPSQQYKSQPNSRRIYSTNSLESNQEFLFDEQADDHQQPQRLSGNYPGKPSNNSHLDGQQRHGDANRTIIDKTAAHTNSYASSATNTTTKSNTINTNSQRQYNNVPSRINQRENQIACSAGNQVAGESINKSIISNYPYPDDDVALHHRIDDRATTNPVSFYYQNESANSSLSSSTTTPTHNLLVNLNQPALDTVPLLQRSGGDNRNYCANKNNSASSVADRIANSNSISNNNGSSSRATDNSYNINKKNNCNISNNKTNLNSSGVLEQHRSAFGSNNRNTNTTQKLSNNYCDSVVIAPARKDRTDANSKRKSYPNTFIKNFTKSSDSIDLCADTRQLLQQTDINTASIASATTAPASITTTNRKQLSYSWYAPVYSALEEDIELDTKHQDSLQIHNLAYLQKNALTLQIGRPKNDQVVGMQSDVADNITQSLLENNKNQINIQPLQSQQQSTPRYQMRGGVIATPQLVRDKTHREFLPFPSSFKGSINSVQQQQQQNEFSRPPSNPTLDYQQSLITAAANQIPRRKRFENFLKTLVGRRTSKEIAPSITVVNSISQQQTANSISGTLPSQSYVSTTTRMPSPEITITPSSSQDFCRLSYALTDTTKTTPTDTHGFRGLSGSGGLSGAESAAHICDNTKIAQNNSSTLSLNTVQQKLWNFMPLLRREGSATSLYNEKSQSIVQYTGLRKCETVLALSGRSTSAYSQLPSSNCDSIDYRGRRSVPGIIYNRSVSYNPAGLEMKFATNPDGSMNANERYSSSNGIAPIRPSNRLRNSASTTNANCSRCSSLMSVGPSGSRYSLNITNNNVHSSCSNGYITMSNNSTNTYNLNKSSNVISNSNSKSNLSNMNNNNSSIYGNLNTSCTTGNLYDALLGSPKHLVSFGEKMRNESVTSNVSSCLDSVDGGISYSVGTTSDGIVGSNQSLKTDISATTATVGSNNTQPMQPKSFDLPFVCKLCLSDVTQSSEATLIGQCNCSFCTECIRAYIDFEISEGAYEISCPDAQCPAQGILTITEIAALASAHALQNHHRYRLNREIELDKNRTWCPRAGCETICVIGPRSTSESASSIGSIVAPATTASTTAKTSASPKETTSTLAAISSTIVAIASVASGSPSELLAAPLLDDSQQPNAVPTLAICSVQCPTCNEEFCSGCKKAWHPAKTCEEFNRQLTATGQEDSIGIPFDNDLIKSCPMCAVPIEKDEGCAQMMCKRCKHVFCWYCLASLDDDFLLRHYDKGPCKNKLGHSRASVVWHRAQVIGIFAGFGILLLVASPLLLLAAPCIICCKCRICSGGNTKIDDPDADFDEATVLQR